MIHKFNSLFNEIEFTLKEYLRISEDKFYCVAKGLFQGEDVLIKVFPLNQQAKIRNSKKELLLGNIFKNKFLDDKIIKFSQPVKDGQNDYCYWMMRRYYSMPTLSDDGNYYDEVLHCYDTIRNCFAHRIGIVDNIVEGMKLLSGLKAEEFVDLEVDLTSRYKINIEDYNIAAAESILETDLSKNTIFYNRYKNQFFEDIYTKLVFGDLVPSNIMVGEDDMLVFSDFEWVAFDNYMNDYSYLWLHLWRHREWQYRLIEKVITNDVNKKMFTRRMKRSLLWNKHLNYSIK